MSRLFLPLWLLAVPVAALAQATLAAGTAPLTDAALAAAGDNDAPPETQAAEDGAPASAAEDDAGAPPAEAADAAAVEGPPRGHPDNPFLGSEVTISQFLWLAHPVVVMADTPNDPAFQRQMELLRARPEALAERHVVVIVDTDPAARSEVRQRLRPRGFALVVLGMDGQVIVRKPAPWDVREISRAIDRTPQRRQEIRDSGSGG